MKHKFSRVVAVITLLLVLASIVVTYIGAFMKGSTGHALLMTGIFGFVAFAILGWVMIHVYERVHMDEEVNEELIRKSEKKEQEAGEASERKEQ